MNSRAKGARGEREWAAFLRALGLKAQRGQQFAGGVDSPDVVGSWPGTHPEVKRVERPAIAKWMEQAIKDSGEQIPYIAHRPNKSPWFITIRADDVVRFAEAVWSNQCQTPSTKVT